MSESDPRDPPRQDPAAPHTMPAPKRLPRWLAWLLLAAFAATGWLCARAAVSG